MTGNITPTTRSHMQEKLAWAERSLARMVDVMDSNPDFVQDHFWSFLHAVHLLWFYFGHWVKQSDQSDSAKCLIEKWKVARLSPAELNAWNSLSGLRNEDAHVQPVVPKKAEGGHLLRDRKTGHLLCSSKSGHLLCSKRKPFRVIQDGKEHELFPLCENGIEAFRKLVSEFETMK